MLVVHSPKHALHHPVEVMRLGRFGPARDVPRRIEVLVAALAAAGHTLVEPAADHGPAPVEAMHTARYLDFLATAHAQWSALPGAARDVLPHTFATRDMTAYPTSVVGRAGFHMQDLVAPIGAGTFEAAMAAANVAVDAAERLVAGERAVYALCRPSGHHAYADMGGGATYLNNAAIAANHLAARLGRVALIDVDVHHANGTQSHFYARGDVFTVSLHRDPHDYWPYLIGYAGETGEGAGRGLNLNLPLPAGSDDETYRAALETACRRIAAFAPAALVVSAGYDAHVDDPSAGLALTEAGFRRIGGRLGALGLPTLLVQEGGYNCDTLGGLAAAFTDGFEAAHGAGG